MRLAALATSSVESSVVDRTGTKLNVAGGNNEPTGARAPSLESGIVDTIATESREVVINEEKDEPRNGEVMEVGSGRVPGVAVSVAGKASDIEGDATWVGELVMAGNAGCANAANTLSVAPLDNGVLRA